MTHRYDKGYATVLLLLMVTVLLAVFTWLVRILDRKEEEAKAAGDLGTAVSGVMAEYNRAVFDRYHILVIDSGFGGRGAGEIEELICQNLEDNSGYTVREAAVTEMLYLAEDDCRELKQQIREALPYLGLEKAAEELTEKTAGRDRPVSEETLDRLEKETEGEDVDVSLPSDQEETGKPEEEKQEGKQDGKVRDPRKGVRKISPAGVALIILPEGASFSDFQMPFSEVPSRGLKGKDLKLDTSFSRFSGLRGTLASSGGWGGALADNAAGVVYAGEMFRCLTDASEEGEKTCLNLEMEYLVSGAATDAENYKKTVKKLIALRMGPNFACLLTDTARMAEVKGIAISVTVLAPYLMPLVKYLIAGCWAYCESIADVYQLLRGEKVSLVKSPGTWKTDLNHLLDFSRLSGKEEKSGLSYREYLMILMAFDMKSVYLRMLDLMQVNVCQEGDFTFRMENAITAFGVDVELELSEEVIQLHEDGGY